MQINSPERYILTGVATLETSAEMVYQLANTNASFYTLPKGSPPLVLHLIGRTHPWITFSYVYLTFLCLNLVVTKGCSPLYSVVVRLTTVFLRAQWSVQGQNVPSTSIFITKWPNPSSLLSEGAEGFEFTPASAPYLSPKSSLTLAEVPPFEVDHHQDHVLGAPSSALSI